jgi:signal transduction histidine kinase
MADPLAAAMVYHDLAQVDDPEQAARALQAEARCRARAGQVEQAIEILAVSLQQGAFAAVIDESGRWIAADADLRILQLASHDSEAFVATVQRLQSRLNHYGNGLLSAAQRWFLMQEARSVVGSSLELPTWDAERMAARWSELRPDPPTGAAVRPVGDDLWQAAVPGHEVVVLFRTAALVGALYEATAAHSVPSGMKVEPLGPGDALAGSELLARSLAPQLPGWRLALTPTGPGTWDSAATRRKRYYLGAAVLMIVTTSALALMIGRAFKRQMMVSRLKNDLVATVSHELKTPLASIRLLVDTLLDGPAADPVRQREYLALIAKENARLTRLIDNFLTFSRLERGKPLIHRQLFDPAPVIEAVAEGCRDRFSGPDCQFRCQIASDLPGIWGDPDALATILLNLLDNAYKYTGPSKRVELRAELCGPDVQIQVRDNGIGLSPRAARRVFERFFRVDDHLARGTEGCGLGLSIVRYLVEAHGGRVWVDSQAGGGSTFVVRLPACTHAVSCAAEGAS